MPLTRHDEIRKSEGHRLRPGIGQCPHFPSPGFSTSTHTRAEDLPLTWNDEGRLVYPLAHVQSRDALKHRTSGTCWHFEGPRLITAGLVQVKDECKMLCSGKVVIQSRCERGTAMLGRAPAVGEHVEKPQKTTVSARTAWENSTARYYPYIRLKQSMSILGLVDPREQLQLICQYKLEWTQMMYHPWEAWHLELIMKRWKGGKKEDGGRGDSRKAEN